VTRHAAITFAAAFLLAAGIGASASAAKRSPDGPRGQQPPQQEQAPAPTPPEQPKCIAQKDDFRPDKTFVVELTNSCERRVRCTIHAYVVNSRGPTKGQATLMLSPAAKGAAARKEFVMKLKEAYGSADVSRRCKEL
jgi:hypothetical protein